MNDTDKATIRRAAIGTAVVLAIVVVLALIALPFIAEHQERQDRRDQLCDGLFDGFSTCD